MGPERTERDDVDMGRFVHGQFSFAVVPVMAAGAWLVFGSLVAGIATLGVATVAWLALLRSLQATGAARAGWVILTVAATVAALIQFVPYGQDHINPPVTAEPVWDSPETRTLAVRACFDCHSRETAWPWYTDVAPVSWLATNHVVEGRAILDFSAWDRPQHELDEIAETIEEEEMAPGYYTILHPSARLTAAEKRKLIDGLRATIAASPPG